MVLPLVHASTHGLLSVRGRRSRGRLDTCSAAAGRRFRRNSGRLLGVLAADGVYDVITCCCCCCCSPVSTGRDSSTWWVAPAREPRRPTLEDLLLLLGWNAG
uniref:(northern house mosquito) hypothetical protein n=1 Tax=Culex pipiens TaxID=7175 RepID=A0A8D8HTV4_CULPI